jgi:SlyX protein
MQDDIIKLQEIISHQQEELARMSDEIYAQQKEIAELQRLFNKLKLQMEQAIAEAATGDIGPERPPPHY